MKTSLTITKRDNLKGTDMARLDALGLITAAHRPSSPLARLNRALAVWRQRRQLAQLDANRLDDLGLSDRDALREANRPFWDVPDHWRR